MDKETAPTILSFIDHLFQQQISLTTRISDKDNSKNITVIAKDITLSLLTLPYSKDEILLTLSTHSGFRTTSQFQDRLNINSIQPQLSLIYQNLNQEINQNLIQAFGLTTYQNHYRDLFLFLNNEPNDTFFQPNLTGSHSKEDPSKIIINFETSNKLNGRIEIEPPSNLDKLSLAHPLNIQIHSTVPNTIENKSFKTLSYLLYFPIYQLKNLKQLSKSFITYQPNPLNFEKFLQINKHSNSSIHEFLLNQIFSNNQPGAKIQKTKI